MNFLPFFLSWRYLLGSKRERSISFMILICFLGITIGSFALALVASIMNGFEKVTHKTMQGIHSQIIIHADGQLIDAQKITAVLQKEFPEVASVSASGSEHAILYNEATGETHGAVIIKGINPQKEPTISTLHKKIIIPVNKSLSTLLTHKSVIIGKSLSESIATKTGEPITLFIAKNNSIQAKKVRFYDKHAHVSGIFKTGIDEFDTGVIFCSLDFFKSLFPDSGPTQLGLTLKSQTNETIIITKLQKRLGLTVHSWKNLYPALVSALKLEKFAMFFILALITLVASMNIISLMFMQITQKRSDIAILKSMGMAENAISKTFLCMGMTIAFLGSVVGLISAFIVGWILQNYPFIKLPDAYYVSHLPSEMTASIFFTVFIVVMILSFISTWISARRTKQINVSHVLRFEG
ncbi:ABC transporter permease [bacterium]|nr:ABC transporter permease [bacterium]